MCACIFIEGFDKYGTPPMQAPLLTSELTQGEWTVASAATPSGLAIVSSLNNTTGYALAIGGGGGSSVQKTLPASYGRLIGGIRFNTNLLAQTNFVLFDNTTGQVSLTINATTGLFSVRGGANLGTVLGTSLVSVTANTTHFLEWDISIGASAAFQVWLDGSSILSGTGNTRGGGINNTINVFQILTVQCIVDDLYLFDSTGGVNNAVLNTAPRIETQFPTADSAVQFSFGAAVFGEAYYMGAGNPFTNGSDGMFLRKFIPLYSGTLNNVSCIPQTTTAAAKTKAVVYADSSGAPGSLMTTGNEVLGTTALAPLTSTLGSPQSLTAGTPYWIGFIYTNFPFLNALAITDLSVLGQGRAITSYAGGAPNPAGTMTANQSSYTLYGNMTGVSGNFNKVNLNPPVGDNSYIFDSVVNDEDLYVFPNLVVTPAAIYTVCVKGNAKKSDSGTRTLDLRLKSGGTDSAGSAPGQTPDTSYRWFGSFFDTDPATAAAWTPTGLNNATSGIKVAS